MLFTQNEKWEIIASILLWVIATNMKGEGSKIVKAGAIPYSIVDKEGKPEYCIQSV